MELHQLVYFAAVADAQNVTRGAAQVQVAQSAVSAAIARLEKEFGLSLFVRTGRGVTLTQAGERLLERALSILAGVEATRADLAALRDGLEGTLTLGVILSTGSLNLTEALMNFHRRHPAVAVRLEISAHPAEKHLTAVTDGTYDLALVPIPARIPDQIAMTPVGTVQMTLASASTHPLARQNFISYASIADETFVDFPPGWGNRDLVDGLFAAHDVKRSVAVETTDLKYAATLVSHGFGLAFLPVEVITESPTLVSLALHDAPPPVAIGLASSRIRAVPSVVSALMRTLLDHASLT